MKYKTADISILISKLEKMRLNRWKNYDNDPDFNPDKLTLDCFLKALKYIEKAKPGALDWYFDSSALPSAGNVCGPSTGFHYILAKLALEG